MTNLEHLLSLNLSIMQMPDSKLYPQDDKLLWKNNCMNMPVLLGMQGTDF